ncbi:hypothetical protein JNK13_11620 [bacterium]|nr:hypothetical protein [bacterium]
MTWWLTRADALIFTSIVGLGMAVLVDRLAPVSNKGRDFIVMLGIIASCAVPIYSAVQTVRNGFWPADLLLFVSSIEPKYDSARLSLCLTLLVVSATAFLSQAVFHELARALKEKKGGDQRAMKQ